MRLLRHLCLCRNTEVTHLIPDFPYLISGQWTSWKECFIFLETYETNLKHCHRCFIGILKPMFNSSDFRPNSLRLIRSNSTLKTFMAEPQRAKLDQTVITISNGGKKEDSGGHKELVVLGFALDSLPKAAQFFICCGGVFLFYLIYGYVQVRMRL